MKLLRRYQLDIIFLFFALIILVGVFFYLLKYMGADPHNYEWFIAGPIIALYFFYLMSIRKKIKIEDRRKITGKSLTYWIVLGIIIVLSYRFPISAQDYWSINVFFIIFTLMLADSYWDFKKINLKILSVNKDNPDKV